MRADMCDVRTTWNNLYIHWDKLFFHFHSVCNRAGDGVYFGNRTNWDCSRNVVTFLCFLSAEENLSQGTIVPHRLQLVQFKASSCTHIQHIFKFGWAFFCTARYSLHVVGETRSVCVTRSCLWSAAIAPEEAVATHARVHHRSHAYKEKQRSTLGTLLN